MNKRLLGIACFFCAGLMAMAQSESQWRGPDRDGLYQETNLLTQWPEGGPRLVWSATGLPKGYSSAAVTDQLIYTTGIVDTMDVLVALDTTGKVVWQTPFGRAWKNSFPDSRSTPTVEYGKIYVESGMCTVACLDAQTGKIIWKVNGYDQFKGKTGEWGYSESLLVLGDKVFFTPGGDQTTMVALDKETGKTIWATKSLNDYTGYVSPLLIHENGKDIILQVLADNLIGVDASNGNILFHKSYATIQNEKSLVQWPGAPYTNTNTPIYYNHEVYITSGYDHVGVKFKLSQDLSEASVVWIDTVLDVHHGGVVLIDGYIYGSNWINNATGNWCCINWDTGKCMYETRWETKGSIIANAGMLYCYEEKRGNLALVKATPDGFNPVSTFKVPLGSGPSWSHPVIHNGKLCIRHGDALMAFDIQAK